MRIILVTPAPRGSRKGNRVTAARWAAMLRRLGHRATVVGQWDGAPCDLLVALHARKSARSIERFRSACPRRPLVVVLTGTDLYRDLATSAAARRSLELADRLIVLQPRGVDALPRLLRARARVVIQSAQPAHSARPVALAVHSRRAFDVCVIGHLRPVKDPFRAALAARLLPRSSRVRVLHLGGALSRAMARRARAEERANPRYRWFGELARWRTRRVLARSRLLVLSSRLEGGANVLSEAIAAGVPVLASRIPGSTGILGDDYPGLFEVGDTRGLAALLERAETEARFYRDLARRCRRLAPLVRPERELEAWRAIVRELGG
jgi:putative glycosyltransferase (TIGR04348 family)